MNRIIKRMALPLGAATVLGTTGFAFMASNAVDVSHTGEGVHSVGGFTIENISYVGCDTANGNDCYTDFFAYATDGSGYIPGSAEIKEGGAWYTCTAQDTYHDANGHTGRGFMCQTNRPSGVNPASINDLTVSVHS